MIVDYRSGREKELRLIIGILEADLREAEDKKDWNCKNGYLYSQAVAELNKILYKKYNGLEE